jgi:hypothetical protein
LSRRGCPRLTSGMGVTGALIVAAGIVAAVYVASAAASPATRAAVEVRELRLVCTSEVVGGARAFKVFLTPRMRGGVASAGVSSGGSNGMFQLAIASAGPGISPRRALLMDQRRCSRVRTAIALSPVGLPQPPVTYQSSAHCISSRRVLIRARVTIDGSRVTRADMAVRLEGAGQPIAYARINRDGNGVFYVHRACS